ncbi:predicted protein [Arabidopsis lyrata subsp. lyrata]|uniref:Predicted protein n=1 Tax=Arabidopsis lyrata subsp. lyrata TaxID=81972 RepID=D7M0E0_ARALL|nr:predicted protein [Arabidopsis lyrata subsp. lyrata]
MVPFALHRRSRFLKEVPGVSRCSPPSTAVWFPIDVVVALVLAEVEVCWRGLTVEDAESCCKSLQGSAARLRRKLVGIWWVFCILDGWLGFRVQSDWLSQRPLNTPWLASTCPDRSAPTRGDRKATDREKRG